MELTPTIVVPPALNAGTVERLIRAIDAALAAPRTRVLVLRGADGSFCHGLDLSAGAPDPAEARRSLTLLAEGLLALRGASVPTLALVDGDALGGGLGVSAACDVVVATPRSRFGMPEALFGLVPAVILPFVRERTTTAAARRLALTATAVDADEARTLGLVDEVSSDLDAALRRFTRRLARPARESVAWLKAPPPALRAAVLAGAATTAANLAEPRVAAAFAAFTAGHSPWEPA